jgi:pimeloyl-ACP methyl ester carboxylesterase/class 3 adenylate cyclase
MPPPVHYAKSGDIHIAYQVVGDGPQDLIWAPGSVSHLDLFWESPYWVRLFERVSSFCRLIRFDKRGTGLSDRPTAVATLEERIEDIRAVMEAAGIEQAHLFGPSEGGSMACLFAATYPQRTRSLTLYGAKPRWVRAADYPWGPTNEELEAWLEKRQASGFKLNLGSAEWRDWLGSPVRDDPAFLEWFERQYRIGASPAAQVALSRMNATIDIRAILQTIRVPTLVLCREDDPVVAVDEARAMAGGIPGARFVVLPGQGHLFFDIWEEVIALIQEFVTGTRSPVPSNRVLTTLLFIDIVGSTEHAVAIGDAAWRDLLQRHYMLTRRALSIFAGTEVDTAGDGLLATFDGPARAIRCARSIQREAAALGLALRAGVHTGEVERVDRAIRGIAVHTVARIAALAAPGEVLVSSTVRDLVAGSGLTFEDRGVHTLRGVAEPRSILAVSGGV